MQTLRENNINYVVFPYQELNTGSLDPGDKIYVLYAYQTMANDTSSALIASASVDVNSRWITATSEIITNGSATFSQLKLQPGTTYNIELKYGNSQPETWGDVSTTWLETTRTFGEDKKVIGNTITLGQDRIFVSGSVLPQEKIYVSSNEDAVLRIYQG